jgi:tRNA(Ile)-lysidine synthase TilS/MesJ
MTAHRPPVVERVAALLQRAGLEAPRPVLALVSGGADSTLLVTLLAEVGFTVRALHVAHALRGGESAADEEF